MAPRRATTSSRGGSPRSPPVWRPIGYAKLAPPAANGFVLTYVTAEGEVRSVNARPSAFACRRGPRTGSALTSAPRGRRSAGPCRRTALRHREPESTSVRPIGLIVHRAAAPAGLGPPLRPRPAHRPDVVAGRAPGCWSAGPPPTSGCSSMPIAPARVVAFDHIAEQFKPRRRGPGPVPQRLRLDPARSAERGRGTSAGAGTRISGMRR